jgi:hypothetical protein
MFDDLDDLLEDVPQAKKGTAAAATGGGKLVSSIGLANKRPQTAKANDDDYDWGEASGGGSQPQQ